MAFKSLLLSKDADLVQNLARVLKDLDVTVEPCSEPFAAAKRLMDQHFDAILVDCEDEQGAGWVLQSARMATASKKSVTIAIVGPQNAQSGVRAGENFVIQKPIVLKQVEATLRAARGLMGDAGSGGSGGAAPANSVSTQAPAVAPAKLAAQAASNPQGRPPAELFDELSAALERLGPQAAAKPSAAATVSGGFAAAAAPAFEKPAPVAPEPPSAPDPVAPQPTTRPSAQAWPGLTTTPATPSKAEAPAVLPLAATAAQMKPASRPLSETVDTKNPFEEARGRMTAAAPVWSPGVEERQEAPAPRFSTFSTDEAPRKRFSFKSLAVAMVLISFALFGYSWYRGKHAASVPEDQAQAPAAVAQQQAQPQTVNSAAAAPTPAVASSDQGNGSDAQPPAVEQPARADRNAPAASPQNSSETIAPDTTTDVGLPPAPLVVKGGRHASTMAPKQEEAQIAPPSLAAVAHTGKPSVAGVVSTAPVEVPKLAAPAAPTVPKRIRVSQGVTQGMLVHQVKPQYPAMARETRVQGDVLLEAVIGKDGSVRDLQVISGPPLLIPPAIRAVRQWRYKPYLLNNEPVEVETQIKLQFRL